MSTINLNVSPYFDDYDPKKDYLRVLFRPGFAVQSRELSQLQTITQNQIQRFGDHVFKDGSRVNEGNIHVNFDVHAMTLISGSGNVNFPLTSADTGTVEGNIGNFSETLITNQAGDVQAKVLKTPTGINESATAGSIFFTYITSKKFTDSDEGFIYAKTADNPGSTISHVNVFSKVSKSAVATIKNGVYYIDGFFTRINEQNVVVSSTTNRPTAAIGFSITSKAITANDDATLFDNARGSTNEGAPGANRLQNSISVLIKSTLDQGSDPTFYKQIEINNGVIVGDTERAIQGRSNSQNPQYNFLGDELAKRRREESGSYYVKKFLPKIRENSWEDSDRFGVSFSPGIAYVDGYRLETSAPKDIYIDRNTEAKKEFNSKLSIKGAPYVDIYDMTSGVLSGMLLTQAGGIGSYQNKLALQDSDGITIGFGRPYGVQVTSTAGGLAKGRLYMHDIKMFQHITIGDSDNSTYDSDHTSLHKGVYVAGEEIKATLIGKVQTGHVIKLDSNIGAGAAVKNDSDWTDFTGTKTIAGVSQQRNGILITNSSAPFAVGAQLSGDVPRGALTAVKSKIKTSRLYDFSQVRRIRAAKDDSDGVGFAAFTDWTPGSGATLKNVGGELLGNSDKTFKTLRSGTVPFDNDFEVMYKSPPTISSTEGGLSVTPNLTDSQWSHNRNGDYKRTRIDDAVEITKTLKYGVLKIRNTDSSRTTAVNSSWSAQDRRINMYYPDLYKVYKIVQATDNNSFAESTTLPSAAFTPVKLSISGGATIPQGSLLIGKESKTRARVALSNTVATGESTLSATTGYHIVKSGTGLADEVQVCFEKGVAFVAGEAITIKVPDRETAILDNITFTSLGTTIAGTDITNNYLVDNGQRADYYGIGSIIRKKSVPAPSSGDLLVFFSYFDADPFQGLFYSVDSYAADGFYSVDPRYFREPQEIKSYEPLNGTNLRNSVDFRFRQRLGSNYSTAQNPLSFSWRNLENTGTHVMPDGQFSTDAEYFLGQKLSFVLNKDAEIKVIPGIGDTRAATQPDLAPGTMLLATIDVPPAVRYPTKTIDIAEGQQRGFTMKDISKIEKRVRNLETSVSLSLLESQALHDNVGTRVKSGFVVDDFSSVISTPGDLQNKEFRASIDTQTNQLRAPSVERDIVLERSDAGTNIDPYYLTQGPGYIMKSYTEQKMLEQTFASELVRINPYAAWTYSGIISLTPNQDFWRDPSWNIVENFFIDRTAFGGGTTSVSEAVFDNLTPVTRDIPNTEFNTTETNWTGTTTTTTTTSLGNIWTWWLGDTTTTTETETGTTTTSNFIAQEEEFTSSSNFNIREVREKDDAFIRSRVVEFVGTGFRPNTDLKAVFDSVDVSNNCQQTDYLPIDVSTTRTYGTVGALRTDGKGQIRGRLTIPARTFKTGTKSLVLTDKDGSATTEGQVIYESRGFFEVGDLVSLRATREAGNRLISQSTSDATRSTSTTTTTPFVWPALNWNFGDPVAQLFTLPLDPGNDPNNFNPANQNARATGSFITSVDIYLGFVDTRTNNDHVLCEIRSTENGYPGRDILGRARVDVTSANANLLKPATKTNFRFDAPVFLREQTEYAIVLLTPSDTTSVWTAQQGQEDVNTGGKIDKQPNVGGYYGSFFSSQNGSTWTPEQNRDLTFTANRAEFTTADSTITMRDKANFYGQPIGQAAQGLAIETFDNSYYIKVHHPNHGMYGPDDTHQVRILGVSGNGTISNGADSDLVRFRGESVLNGIPTSFINNVSGLSNLTTSSTTARHKVKNATQDTYMIDLSEQDSDSAAINSNPVTGGWHKSVKAGKGGGENVVATGSIQYDAVRTNTSPIIFDETTVESQLKTTSGANLILRAASNLFGYSTGDQYYDSPQVKETSFNRAPIDRIVGFSSPRLVNGSMNKTATADFEQQITLKTTNKFVSPVIRLDSASTMFAYKNNIGTYIDDSDMSGLVATPVTATSTATAQTEFAAFQAGISSRDEQAGYITKVLKLDVPASQIRMFFDADMDPSGEFNIRYKTRAVGDNTEFGEIEFETFPRTQIVNETNFGKFKSSAVFEQFSLTQDLGKEFDAFQIKIEMNSKNSSFISKLRDLRIIAVA